MCASHAAAVAMYDWEDSVQDKMLDSLCNGYDDYIQLKDFCSPDILEGIDLGDFFSVCEPNVPDTNTQRSDLTPPMIYNSGESYGAIARRTHITIINYHLFSSILSIARLCTYTHVGT